MEAKYASWERDPGVSGFDPCAPRVRDGGRLVDESGRKGRKRGKGWVGIGEEGGEGDERVERDWGWDELGWDGKGQSGTLGRSRFFPFLLGRTIVLKISLPRSLVNVKVDSSRLPSTSISGAGLFAICTCAAPSASVVSEPRTKLGQRSTTEG